MYLYHVPLTVSFIMYHWFTEGEQGVYMSSVHDKAEMRYIHFNECLHIANAAFMDFCEPLVVAMHLAYLLHTLINATNHRTLCLIFLLLLSFMMKHSVTSRKVLNKLTLFTYLRIIKELQTYRQRPHTHTPSSYLTWLTYTLPLMQRSIVFHCNGELWCAGRGNPLCALESFTGAMKSKALTHGAKYAWCFQYHLPNGWIRCSGFHRKAQKLFCHILGNHLFATFWKLVA